MPHVESVELFLATPLYSHRCGEVTGALFAPTSAEHSRRDGHELPVAVLISLAEMKSCQ